MLLLHHRRIEIGPHDGACTRTVRFLRPLPLPWATRGLGKVAAGVGIAPTSRALQARAHLSMPSSERGSLRQDLHPHWSVPKTDASAVGLRRENEEPRQGLAPCSVAYEATASLSMLARQWSGWRDSHPRFPVPQTGALAASLQPDELVPARGNAPRSSDYQPVALLLSYAGDGGRRRTCSPGPLAEPDLISTESRHAGPVHLP